jgi:hypothetical protein
VLAGHAGGVATNIAALYDAHLPARVELCVAGPVRVQLLAQDARRLVLDPKRVAERAQGVAELQQEGLPFLALAQGAFGAHPLGRLDRRHQQARRRARLVAKRAVGEGEEGGLPFAASLDDDRQVLADLGASGAEHAFDPGAEVGPDVGPRLPRGRAEERRAPVVMHVWLRVSPWRGAPLYWDRARVGTRTLGACPRRAQAITS